MKRIIEKPPKPKYYWIRLLYIPLLIFSVSTIIFIFIQIWISDFSEFANPKIGVKAQTPRGWSTKFIERGLVQYIYGKSVLGLNGTTVISFSPLGYNQDTALGELNNILSFEPEIQGVESIHITQGPAQYPYSGYDAVKVRFRLIHQGEQIKESYALSELVEMRVIKCNQKYIILRINFGSNDTLNAQAVSVVDSITLNCSNT